MKQASLKPITITIIMVNRTITMTAMTTITAIIHTRTTMATILLEHLSALDSLYLLLFVLALSAARKLQENKDTML